MQGAMSGRLEQALILVRLWYESPETVLFGLGILPPMTHMC